MAKKVRSLLMGIIVASLLVLSTSSLAAAHTTSSCHHSTSQPAPPRYGGQWWDYFSSHWTNQYGHYHRYAHYVWYDPDGWLFSHYQTNVCGGGTLVSDTAGPTLR